MVKALSKIIIDRNDVLSPKDLHLQDKHENLFY